MKRPVLIALIGYLIGILWGLYFKISIAFLFVVVYCLYLLLKIIKAKNILRYLKVFFNWKVLVTIVVFAIISNIIVNHLDYKYKNTYKNIAEENFIATVVSSKKIKKYNIEYKIKVESINENKKYKNTYLLLNISTKNKTILEYGDKIEFKGEYSKPNTQRNYKGFDYSKYLKSISIYGNVKASSIHIIEKNKGPIIGSICNRVSNKIEKTYEKLLPNENTRNLLLGILLGNDDNLDKEIKEDFKNSSLSHILAVSGMHVSYVILGISIVLSKSNISKRTSKIITIAIIIFFMYLTNLSPSVVRAGIMGILVLGGNILYRKSDICTSISLSLLIILICNPYSIMNIGLILSFFGTVGIILLYKNILNIFNIFNKRNTQKLIETKRTNKLCDKIKEIVAVSVSAQIYILPIIMLYFNKISITFLFSNLLVSFIIGAIIILGFLVIIVSLKFMAIARILSVVLNLLLEILIYISSFFSKLSLSKITVVTPSMCTVIIYYACIIFISYILSLEKNSIRYTQKKLLTFVNNVKIQIAKRKKLLIIITLIIITLNYLYCLIPKNLRIHFIDVGQGDSTLIITPTNKTILIDGGGSKEAEEFDVGEATLLPYLLDRKINTIDYMMISHFDADHCNGLIEVLENLKVKKIIISKQAEICNEYNNIIKLIKRKNIEVIVVKAGNKIQIDNNVFIDIIYPQEKLEFEDINNNSIIAKLVYNNFSMLFTGDIEKEAERNIINNYGKIHKLQSTILKIAHHGSKTSTTEDFLKLVNPQIGLIRSRRKQYFWSSIDTNNRIIKKI